MTGVACGSSPRRSTSPCCSAFRLPRSAFVLSSHRPKLAQPPRPRDVIRRDPDPEPHKLAREALHDRRAVRSEEHTSELQSHSDLVCRLLLEKKKRRTNLSRSTCKTGP